VPRKGSSQCERVVCDSRALSRLNEKMDRSGAGYYAAARIRPVANHKSPDRSQRSCWNKFMTTQTRTADDRGRVTLPKSFANRTVLIQQINETEVRVCLVSESRSRRTTFIEETSWPLSDAARDQFLKLLDAPPKPNAELKRALNRHRLRHA